MSVSQSHGHIFEMTVEIILFITFRTKQTYVQDIMDDVVTGVDKRTVQRYMRSLEKLEYVKGDSCCPQGFVPTDKAKQLFGVNA